MNTTPGRKAPYRHLCVGQYGGYIARFAVQKGWPIVAPPGIVLV